MAKNSNATTEKGGFTPPKIAKRITLSTLRFNVDEPLYVKITKPIVEKLDTVNEKKKKEGEASKFLHIARVVDLSTGEEAEIVVPAVVLSTLSENYGNEAYVNKSFELCKLPQKAGKNYFPYRINELED